METDGRCSSPQSAPFPPTTGPVVTVLSSDGGGDPVPVAVPRAGC